MRILIAIMIIAIVWFVADVVIRTLMSINPILATGFTFGVIAILIYKMAMLENDKDKQEKTKE